MPNLVVKECMSLAHETFQKIRKTLSAIRSSNKRPDAFSDVKIEMEVQCEVPSLNMETRWSSTFHMIRKCFPARHVLTAVVAREEELEDYMMGEAEWNAGERVCAFLEDAAVATEHQSRWLYVTLGFTLRVFEKPERNCCGQKEHGDEFMNSISAAMLQNQEQYTVIINKRSARCARVIDLRFKTDIMNDSNVLREFVSVTSSSEYVTVCKHLPSKR